MRAQHAELMRKPNLHLFFYDRKETEFGNNYLETRDNQVRNDRASVEWLNGTPAPVGIRFYLFNDGSIAVSSAYVRVWLPDGWRAEYLEAKTRVFYPGGSSEVDGQMMDFFDLNIDTPLYPGVEIEGPLVKIIAPRRACRDIRYRIFTDRFYFPDPDYGRLTITMPDSDEAYTHWGIS